MQTILARWARVFDDPSRPLDVVAAGFLLGVFLALLAWPAWAQDADGLVIVPWGDWVGEIVTAALGFVAVGVAWVLRRVPAGVLAVIQTLMLDRLLVRAVGYALNTTAGAVKGKALRIDVANQVVERALDYAVAQAPAVLRWLLGVTGRTEAERQLALRIALKPDVIAAIDVEEAAALAPALPPRTPAG